MKPLNSYISYGVIILLAIGLTVASLRYVRPADCQRFCDKPEPTPCPSGSCRSGEQRAGFPLPVVIDSGAGSSPTSGWGKLGPEDLPNPVTPVLDVLFYSVLLWLLWKVLRVLWGKDKPRALLAMLPLLVLVLAILMLGYFIDAPLSSPGKAGQPDLQTTPTKASPPLSPTPTGTLVWKEK